MKTLLLFTAVSLALSLSAFAAENPLKPGLWEMSSTMKMGDKKINPQLEMEKAVANLPAEQRKRMAEMMAKSGGGSNVSSGGWVKVCYTREMLARKDFGTEARRECTSTIKEQTAKRMTVDFKCQDGSTGSGEWNFLSPALYDGKMKFVQKSGEKSEMTVSGRFIKDDCGDVKPIHMPKS